MSNKPTGVMVIALLHLVLGVPWVAAGIYLFMAATDLLRVNVLGVAVGAEVAKYLFPAAGLALLVGAAYVSAAWGLWNLRNWARAAVITIAALALLAQVVAIVGVPNGLSLVGGPTLVYAAVEVAMIYYLLMPQTAAVFGAGVPISGSSTCPHCLQSGITPNMTVCPYCRQSLLEPLPSGPGVLSLPYSGEVYMEPKTSVPARSSGTTRIGPSQAPVLAWLVVKSGPGAGTTFNLNEDNEIGRDGRCQIRLDDDYVSRSHARVKLEDGNFVIYDLGATGGTFVNERKVQRLMLRDGATIRLGQTMLEFKKTATAR